MCEQKADDVSCFVTCVKRLGRMKIEEINIKQVMDKLGEVPRIYQVEAQFQFELAWELQKLIGDDGQVLLEVGMCTRKANAEKKVKRKRFYSDIILKGNDNSYIVIELKYKKKAAVINGIELTSDYASDEGRYDYLWDIRRIELLKECNNDDYEYTRNLGSFRGGYAIILTNDMGYWNKIRDKEGKTVDALFTIGDGDSIQGRVDWNVDIKKPWMKSRPAFELSNSYCFEWLPYYGADKEASKEETCTFKYLITKIDA